MLYSGFHVYSGGAVSFVIEGRELPVILILAVSGLALQIFLSWKEKRLYGLLLPSACFFCALAAFAARMAGTGAPASRLLLILLPESLPALVLLAAYAVCRHLRWGRRRRGRELEKTRIGDL